MAEPKLARSAEKLKDSASRMERGTLHMEFSADRRTELAADRTVFAAERTYAAWVRTGLVALASGIGARALLANVVSDWLITMTGGVLVLFSAFCFAAAVWRNFYRPQPPPVAGVVRIHPSVLMVVNGFLILVALAAFVDVVFGRVIT